MQLASSPFNRPSSLRNTANSIKVDIDNSQMYDLGNKKDGNNHSFMHEDATNIMLSTIFVILQGH